MEPHDGTSNVATTATPTHTEDRRPSDRPTDIQHTIPQAKADVHAIIGSKTSTDTDSTAQNGEQTEAALASQRFQTITGEDVPSSKVQPEPTNQTKTKDAKSTVPKDLWMKRLPSVEEIQRAIPSEGIELKELAKKFAKYLDGTNARLFAWIIKVLGHIEGSVLVKPLDRAPDYKRIARLRKSIVKPPEPRAGLLTNQSIKSQLKEGVAISFSEPEEQLRDGSGILPPHLWRVNYEQSATLSVYTAEHNQVKHREVNRPQLREDAAFQSLSKFDPLHDLTCLRIERHLKWNKIADPTSYISAFGVFNNAAKRAQFLYHKSGQRNMSQRIIIAQIDTKDLVPVTIRAVLRETIGTTSTNGDPTFSTTERKVRIPAWVHKRAVPVDQSPISLEQLSASGSDIWLSIREIKMSNLKVPASRSHWYEHEWLAGGVIPKSRISEVWPYDGQRIHYAPSSYPVRSTGSSQPWVFDWQSRMWVLDLRELRKRGAVAEEVENGQGDTESRSSKRRKVSDDQQDDQPLSVRHGKHCTTCTCRRRLTDTDALFEDEDEDVDVDVDGDGDEDTQTANEAGASVAEEDSTVEEDLGEDISDDGRMTLFEESIEKLMHEARLSNAVRQRMRSNLARIV